MNLDNKSFCEISALAQYIEHFNIHYTLLLRRYQRFAEIEDPLNDDIDVSTYFDMIIVQLRAMCIESPNHKNNYTAQILLRKVGKEELADKIDDLLERPFIGDSDITVKKAIKILADGFICHYDNYDGPAVETWGMALAIEAKLRNPYEKINLKYIMEVLKACIGEGLALK